MFSSFTTASQQGALEHGTYSLVTLLEIISVEQPKSVCSGQLKYGNKNKKIEKEKKKHAHRNKDTQKARGWILVCDVGLKAKHQTKRLPLSNPVKRMRQYISKWKNTSCKNLYENKAIDGVGGCAFLSANYRPRL